MGKNDFDIDFDFEKEYGFDPKAFLGTEEYDDDIDLSEFSDEELGLRSEAEVPAAKESADSSFDAEDDLDLDGFLNMGSLEEPEEDYAEEAPVEEIEEEPVEEDEEKDDFNWDDLGGSDEEISRTKR